MFDRKEFPGTNYKDYSGLQRPPTWQSSYIIFYFTCPLNIDCVRSNGDSLQMNKKDIDRNWVFEEKEWTRAVDQC